MPPDAWETRHGRSICYWQMIRSRPPLEPGNLSDSTTNVEHSIVRHKNKHLLKLIGFWLVGSATP